MSKVNSKKIMSLVAIVALVAILGICLVACNSSNVGKKLEDKGYKVVTLNEDATGIGKSVYSMVKDNSDFKEGLWATKQLNTVAVVWYKNLDAAKDAEEAFKSIPLATVYRADKIVYVGTQQGVEDAK